MTMLYYVVTEGRANVLDRLNLRDRSTYGVDWMVFYASSARDGVRQWNLYKAGMHSRQAELEAEAIQYRVATAGYAPPWEAEPEVVGMDAARRLGAVETEQKIMRDAQADLNLLRKGLRRVAAAAPEPLRPRRRSSPAPRPSKRAPRRPTKAKAAKRGATKKRTTATKSRRRR
jgi:hypothetical protein